MAAACLQLPKPSNTQPAKLHTLDTHSDTIRLRLLRLLADNPQLTQRELAQALGVSLGATHYSLRALIESIRPVAPVFHSPH